MKSMNNNYVKYNENSNAVFKNKPGTVNLTCSCCDGGWIQYWANANDGILPTKCAVAGCNGKAEVGGHVHVVGESVNPPDWTSVNHNAMYIIPMCYSCNNEKERKAPFWVKGEYYPVSV